MIISITSANSAHNQFLRLHVETVVGGFVGANRVKRLSAHLAKLAFGDVDKVGSAREGVLAKRVHVLGRIFGDDKTLIDGMFGFDAALDWRNCAAHRGYPLRLGFCKEGDRIMIFVVVQGE